jgi:uncharacterized protein
MKKITTKKTLLILLISLPILYLGVSLLAFFKQDVIIFGPREEFISKPEDFQVNYQIININITNNNNQENLFAWWLQPDLKTSVKKDKIILLFHGSDGNISDALPQGIFFRNLGFSVVLLEYRGYGQSKGDFPTEKQVFEDGQIAYNYLVNEKNINPNNIIVYGHSLGGALAIDLASHNPEIGGLILQSTITNMMDTLKADKKYKYLPLDLIITEKFNSIDKISSLQMPLLIIHGMDDVVVPYNMAEELFAKATSPKKKLVLMPEGDHVNFMELDPKKYQIIIEEFYQDTL